MPKEDIQPEGQGTNPTDEEVTTDDSTENEEEVAGETEAPEQPDLALELERERKKNYELAQRLKKEKSKSEKTRTDLETPDVPTSENAIQEQVLKAQGMETELIAVLKTISEDQGVDLITAQKDDYFLFRKEKFEQEKKDKEAGLGASKGSGQGKPKKDFSTPGLSQDEHKKLWKRAMKS